MQKVSKRDAVGNAGIREVQSQMHWELRGELVDRLIPKTRFRLRIQLGGMLFTRLAGTNI